MDYWEQDFVIVCELCAGTHETYQCWSNQGGIQQPQQSYQQSQGEELPWWAYSGTSMPQQSERCLGIHETSQYCYYEGVDPYVTYEEQPYFQYHPQQYQQDVPNMSYFFGNEEFQHQQPTPTMEELRMLTKSNEESIKSLETLVAQAVRALEQEKQQFIPEAISENNGDLEQGTACIIEEDKFQEEVSVHEPCEEFDHASMEDDLERAQFGTDTGELHKFQELVCAYQEADDHGKDAGLLLVSEYTDGGSALEPMVEVLFEEPKASATYIYPPPLYSSEARECVLFYKLTDFGSTDEGIGIGHSCYTNRPSEEKGQKVCRRDDDEVSRRDDQANYYHP
jgi:hypothetical protein